MIEAVAEAPLHLWKSRGSNWWNIFSIDDSASWWSSSQLESSIKSHMENMEFDNEFWRNKFYWKLISDLVVDLEEKKDN